MILRDYFCLQCGEVKFDVAEDTDQLYCKNCKKKTAHGVVCNGGANSRWRFCDFPDDPEWWQGRTSSKVTAHYKDDDGVEHKVEHKDGGVIHEQDKFVGDGSSEKRDKIRHNIRKRFGKEKIFVDGGKNARQ
jgi:hypothetical protein